MLETPQTYTPSTTICWCNICRREQHLGKARPLSRTGHFPPDEMVGLRPSLSAGAGVCRWIVTFCNGATQVIDFGGSSFLTRAALLAFVAASDLG